MADTCCVCAFSEATSLRPHRFGISSVLYLDDLPRCTCCYEGGDVLGMCTRSALPRDHVGDLVGLELGMSGGS
ncbi:hypothetical protein NDU88_002352 [Pleurodeles waltl]|uniref:Uncharacterized protein n=1 Tax=Pleurodeles waltl TaxID=8319 RepID=A0AAV7SD03_PLEWA|nr:hypothetical protein NDU88_002352 [Pleurodeles waltl]